MPIVVSSVLLGAGAGSMMCFAGTTQMFNSRPKPKAIVKVEPVVEKPKESKESANAIAKRALIQHSPARKPGADRLLGQTSWIYRLVCSEDIPSTYELKGIVGKGGFGTVFEGRHKDLGVRRAVKKINKKLPGLKQDELMNEIFALMDLDHPHVMKLNRLYDDGDYFWIVSELCQGPTLSQRIDRGPMSEQEAGTALRHILKGVECCHSRYFGHFDIKPDNFMYSTPDCRGLKMLDLGLSGDFKRNCKGFRGTYLYAAPEVWIGTYGPEADIWSCGAILYEMTTGKLLCGDVPDEEIASHVQDRNWVKSKLRKLTEAEPPPTKDCIHLTTTMLRSDRHMRVTAREAMSDPYILKTYKTSHHCSALQKAATWVLHSLVDSLRQFSREKMLVRAGLLVMVHVAGYVTKEAQAHRLAYAMLDKKGIGELSAESIETVMLEYGFPVPEDFDSIFRQVDLNRDGYITYGDFLAATLPLNLRCRQDLCKRVFDLFDQDRSGFITADDLKTCFQDKDEKSPIAFESLCRCAIAEVCDSIECHEQGLRFDDFFAAMLNGREPIEGLLFVDEVEGNLRNSMMLERQISPFA